MKKETIISSKGLIELCEFVESLYLVSEKANRALEELRKRLLEMYNTISEEKKKRNWEIQLCRWEKMNLHLQRES